MTVFFQKKEEKIAINENIGEIMVDVIILISQLFLLLSMSRSE